MAEQKYRIGIGYDIHRLTENRDLIIGGVKIPYEKGLLGHSDADVLIHAIIDALLGALSLDDIGTLFPDTDDRFKDADSMILLRKVYDKVQAEGYWISNLDTNIIAQAPKMMSHIPQMKATLSPVLGLDITDISIKAKTKEKLGNIKTVSLEDLAPTFRETGCVPMDLALTNGKGMPVGASILMYAPAGVGKTTIFADMCRNLIESSLAKGEEYKIVYVDVEGSRNLLLSMGLGKYMISGNLILKEGAITFAQLEDIYAKILAWHELDSEDSKNSKKLDPEYKDVKLIIVDSLSQVQSQALMEKGVDDGDFGSNAKERSRFYPKYFARCKACGVTNMYIAQMRVNVNAVGMFDPKEKPAVSTSDLFNYDIIIKASKTDKK